MNRTTDAIQIGEWSFSANTGELRRDGDRRALEDRAARVLALLASQRGEIVSHEDLIAKVWNGRSVSANSVAIVIGDLRRALGDDAKAPRFIETISKRGYRLAAAEAQTAAPTWRQRPFIVFGALAASLVLVAAVGVTTRAPTPHLSATVTEVSNETGDARYAPLAHAVTELVVTNTSSSPRSLQVTRASASLTQPSMIVVNGRLILWSGHPSVSLNAVDYRTGQVVWSGIAPGPEDSLPGQVRTEIDMMKDALARR